MEEIKDTKFVNYINSPFQKMLSTTVYVFKFDEDTQSIYVQDNQCFVLEKEDVEVLIKGLQNSLNNFPEKEFKEWNENKLHRIKDNKETVVKSKNKIKPKKKGYIYFITDDTGFVKIGMARDVFKRFKAMKIGNPTLRILHYIKVKDSELQESLLHDYFKDKRISGEWFKLDEKDLNYINSLKGDLDE